MSAAFGQNSFNRLTTLRACLSRNPDRISRCFMTMDETRTHITYRIPSSSRQLEFYGRIYTEEGQGEPGHQQGYGNSFLWCTGIFHMDHVLTRRIINGNCYTNLLSLFNDDLSEKRSHSAKMKTPPTKTMQDFTSEWALCQNLIIGFRIAPSSIIFSESHP